MLYRLKQWWLELCAWWEVQTDLFGDVSLSPPDVLEPPMAYARRRDVALVVLPFGLSYSVEEAGHELPLEELEDLGQRLRDPLDRRLARERGDTLGGWSYLLKHHPEDLSALPPGVRQLVEALAERERQEWS